MAALVDDLAALAALRCPPRACEVAPGIRFDPTLTRSEVRDGVIYLRPAFFRLDAGQRETALRSLQALREPENPEGDVAAIARTRRPAGPAKLAPWVEYDPTLRRSTTRGEVLCVPPGFFRLAHSRRETVLRNHLRRRPRLAEHVDALRQQDRIDLRAALAAGDAHLHLQSVAFAVTVELVGGFDAAQDDEVDPIAMELEHLLLDAAAAFLRRRGWKSGRLG